MHPLHAQSLLPSTGLMMGCSHTTCAGDMSRRQRGHRLFRASIALDDRYIGPCAGIA